MDPQWHKACSLASGHGGGSKGGWNGSVTGGAYDFVRGDDRDARG
jgi:hypothetical protein